MSKPEYCWIKTKDVQLGDDGRVAFYEPFGLCWDKFQIIREESGEVIRLERVEG